MRQRAFESQRLLGWLLPAMVLSQGLQLLRVFIPSLAWYLRDTQGSISRSPTPLAPSWSATRPFNRQALMLQGAG
jgi:hypothetical protein